MFGSFCISDFFLCNTQFLSYGRFCILPLQHTVRTRIIIFNFAHMNIWQNYFIKSKKKNNLISRSATENPKYFVEPFYYEKKKMQVYCKFKGNRSCRFDYENENTTFCGVDHQRKTKNIWLKYFINRYPDNFFYLVFLHASSCLGRQTTK